jgi:hypothetical protein
MPFVETLIQGCGGLLAHLEEAIDHYPDLDVAAVLDTLADVTERPHAPILTGLSCPPAVNPTVTTMLRALATYACNVQDVRGDDGRD